MKAALFFSVLAVMCLGTLGAGDLGAEVAAFAEELVAGGAGVLKKDAA